VTSYLSLKLLHILALVYWLGGDLGTFLSSRYVVDASLTPAQRQIALRIMLGCDQGPKLSMPLIFAIGYSMAGLAEVFIAPAWLTAAVWTTSLLWFANVNYLYFAKNLPLKARLTQIDLWFRVVLVVALLAIALKALITKQPFHADWLATKIIVFAALVACGIYIRLQLKPFVAAFVQLQSSGSTPAVEQTLTRSLARCRPAVFLIWLGLLLNSAIGLHLLNP
jgi:hypothetical protein